MYRFTVASGTPNACHDISLPHRPIGDQLAGPHAEALQILLVVLKHRQQAVEIHHLPVLSLERQVLGDGGQTVRKDRQLELRHGHSFPPGDAPRKHRFGANLGRAIFRDRSKSPGEIRSSETRLDAQTGLDMSVEAAGTSACATELSQLAAIPRMKSTSAWR